jgi:hypothetical protein
MLHERGAYFDKYLTNTFDKYLTNTCFSVRINTEDIVARSREAVKCLIELAESPEEADTVLSQEFADVKEKYAYLRGMFDFTIVGAYKPDIENDYKAALSAIVNQKWRA